SNLERNLYLTMQLKELEVPVILVLNMSDVAEKNQVKINHGLLSQLLGIPVVRAVGSKNEGIRDILEEIVNYDSGQTKAQERQGRYRPEIEDELARLQEQLQPPQPVAAEAAAGVEAGTELSTMPFRWLLIKL
ncbi:MAG TPA: hypothetical protein DER60_09675, partial [Syntrophomonas sp.]|nr:hypothetical protein [Syntrophomonas sp.]